MIKAIGRFYKRAALGLEQSRQHDTYLDYINGRANRLEKDSLFYQAQLYHAWRAIASQNKGMQRQARKLKRKDRFIAALQKLIDDKNTRITELEQKVQQAALDWLSLEGQMRDMNAELAKYRELVGVHKGE